MFHIINILLIGIQFLTLPKHSEEIFKSSEYWKGEDKIVKHTIVLDDSQDYCLYEKRNEKGETQWYEKRIYTDVCMTDKCKFIDIKIFWDAIGNYMGFELFPGDSLTKSLHKKFTKDDYKKLDSILSNPHSILKNYTIKELVKSKNKKEKLGLDATTGATIKSIENYIVEDAVYTTYTLWHIVYGQTQKKIHDILENKKSPKFLLSMLNSNQQDYQIWAIKNADGNFHQDSLLFSILELVGDNNAHVAREALNALPSDIISDPKIQKKLIKSFKKVNTSRKLQILFRLNEIENVSDFVIEEILDQFVDNELGVAIFKHTMDLLQKKQKVGSQIKKRIINFLDHDNLYVSRKAYFFLKGCHNLSFQEKRKLNEF